MEAETEKVLAFLDTLPVERRLTLARLRTMISRAAPRAVELFQHDMPTYDLQGPLFQFGAEKAYLALYISEPNVLESFRGRLGELEIGTTCVRFRDINDFPPDVLKDLLRAAVAARTGLVPRRPENRGPAKGKPENAGRGPRRGPEGRRGGPGRGPGGRPPRRGKPGGPRGQ